MSTSTKKRTIDAFFKPPAKKAKVEDNGNAFPPSTPSVEAYNKDIELSHHTTYPFPIPAFSASISDSLALAPVKAGKVINDQADLDLLYFEPFVPRNSECQIFRFLRAELPFYRVQYNIRRGGIETQINTPRYTTVFGVDETSRFDDRGEVIDAKTGMKVMNDNNYRKYSPRPIPKCLETLRVATEAATGCKFNFCLVNYYASGSDSISFHSDDERFLGDQPAIASFSFGAKRDFLMKHKPIAPKNNAPPPPETKLIKLPLASGDMILMRGRTQSNWLHSIPKRTGKNAEDGGRINITFRKALVKGGTENYYNYNVGTGPPYKWQEASREMKLWSP